MADGSQTANAYVANTSIIGLLAFIAGLQVLIAASETALGVPMIAMVVLWASATGHHVILARPAPARRRALRPAASGHRTDPKARTQAGWTSARASGGRNVRGSDALAADRSRRTMGLRLWRQEALRRTLTARA
jgi:hypothetical protein